MWTPSRELRQSSRLRMVMPVLCRHEGGTARALAQDISREGIFLRLAEYIPPSSISAIELLLPDERVPLVLPVSVRFIGRTFSGFGIGARFLELAVEQRQRWMRFYDRVRQGAAAGPEAAGGRVIVTAGSLTPALREGLEATSMAVVRVHNNREALAQLRPHCAAVVLAELHDAQLSGIELCRRIRRRRALARVAVILVTGSESASDFLTGLGAGAAFVIARPFSAEYCASRVLTAARRREPQPDPRRTSSADADTDADEGAGAEVGGTPLHALSVSYGVEVEYLHAPSILPACLVRAADRISDAYFVAKLVARSRLRKYRAMLGR